MNLKEYSKKIYEETVQDGGNVEAETIPSTENE